MESIDEKTGSRLLQVARAAVACQVTGVTSADPVGELPWPPLERCGVFVTLRNKGRLRGCIGTFHPQSDLPHTVAEMAAAATRDQRFVHHPITQAELDELNIELSILSPLSRIEDPLSFELGRHGIYLKYGSASGCFLPDVGAEAGWDKETFLSELCRQKAGLSPSAWKDKPIELFVFTVQKITR